MTPKDKAQELVDKFTLSFSPNIEEAVQCALIATDEIISVAYWTSVRQYWQEVKQEIEKL